MIKTHIVNSLNYSNLEDANFKLSFQQANLVVDVHTDNLELLSHMKAYLHYDTPEKLKAAKWKVNIYTEQSHDFNDIDNKSEDFFLEYKDPGKLYLDGEWRIIHNLRTNSYIFINHYQHKASIFNHDKMSAFVDAYKAVRQVIAEENLLQGFIPLHCSSLSYAGQGIAFIGDSGSGKTTLLTAALLSKGRLSGFLGNDRALISCEENTIKMHSWPTVLGIGPGALFHLNLQQKAIPSLHDKAGGSARWLIDHNIMSDENGAFSELSSKELSEIWSWPQKLWLTPMEVATICNCNLESNIPLRFIIFPELNSKNKSTSIDRISSSDAEKIIKRNLLEELPFYPKWTGFPTINKEKFELAVSQFIEIIKNVPMYKLIAGDNAMEAVEYLFKQIDSNK